MNRREMLICGLAVLSFGRKIPAASKPDPTGNWKWSATRSDQDFVEVTAKFKYANGKLTGTVKLPNKKEVAIEDASFSNDEVSFSITEPGPKGTKVITKYRGNFSDDSIEGEREITRNGKVIEFEWEATRQNP